MSFNTNFIHIVVVTFAVSLLTVSLRADILLVPSEYPTIQAGIDAAVDGDEVVVADGTYTGDGNRDMDFGGKAITVRSENGPAACIIDLQADENDPHRAFYFDNQETNESVLDGFTIRNGFMEFGGSAIRLSRGANPTIRRCNFNSNQGSAAVDIGTRARPQRGILVDCLFVGNVEGALDVGGLDSFVTVVNCTFVRNSRSSGGAAITAQTNGDKGSFAIVFVHNSLIWGNTPVQMSEIGGHIHATYCNVQGGWDGEGNIDLDPRFVDPDNGDFRLSPNSPCIDAGDNNAVPKGIITTDLDGNPRFHDDPCTTDTGIGGPPTVDIGAYEFQGTSVCPADLIKFIIVTGDLLQGNLDDLIASDDLYVHTRSGFGITLVDLHNMEMIVSAETTVDAATSIDLTIESRIDEPAGLAQIRMRNWNSNQFEQVGSYSIGNTDQVDTINNIDATNYIDNSGGIDLSIKHVVFVPFLAFTFESFIDQVEIILY